ncbi:MAG: hypothetical protein ACE5J2_07845 [Nitrososphaerales archaeon]
MAGRVEMRVILEGLLDELLSRKEGFQSIFNKMQPVIDNKADFFVAFFLGYFGNSYKQLFLTLKNRDMRSEEIDELLQFLIASEPKVREAFVGREMREKVVSEISEGAAKREVIPEVSISELKEEIMPVSERVNAIEFSVDEIRRQIKIVKQATREKINRYEVNLAKIGKFEPSRLALTD